MTTKTIARWVTIGALFILPFISLYVSKSLYFPFITGKNFAFRALVEIAFAGWLVLIACDKRYRPRFSWTLVWYKSLVVWMVVANLLAVNPHKAFWSNYERMDGWVTLAHLYILLVVLSSVLSVEKLWRKWWLAFIAANALVCVYGLAQLAGISAIHQGSTRIDATIGNAEYFAGFLLFAIAVTLWQAFETRAKEYVWLRYSLFALAVVQFVLLFETGTRGTLIGLIAAGVFGSVLWMKEAGKQGRKTAASVLIVLVVIVGGLFAVRNVPAVQQNPTLSRLTSVFSLKAALGPRITIWGMAVEGIKEKPLTGWGQEGFNYVFNKYYQPSLYAQEPWFDRAHNMFLDWGIAGGIPALLFFVLALISAFVALYRAPVSRFERIMLLSALVGYAVQGLVVFDNLFTYLPFIAILAMAHMASSRPIKLMETTPEITGANLDMVVAPVAIIVGAVMLWFINAPSVLAGTHLIEAITPANSPEQRLASFKQAVNDNGLAHQEIVEQLVTFASQEVNDSNASQETRQAIVDYAGAQMNAELLRAPMDARLLIQYAIFFRTLGDYKDAQQESAQALANSPRKQSILIESGIELFQSGDYSGAKQQFEKAYALDKNYKDVASYIAGAQIANKDIAGGKSLLMQTYGTTTVDQPMIVVAYYQNKDWNDLIDIMRLKYRLDNSVTNGFQLAAVYLQAGRKDDAIAQVRTVIVDHPEAAAQGTAILQQLGVTP
jgi:O-antigen ligase/tetratricopeptide (TPR) repeat protein